MNLLSRLVTPSNPSDRAGLVELFPTWASTTESTLQSLTATFAGNGVVFATVLARMKVFSEVRFTWRRYRNNETFGTADLDMLERPWPGATASELLARMQQDVCLAGNSYIHRVGDRLQRLDPLKVDVLSNGKQKTGYIYWPDGRQGGQGTPLILDEVAHWAPIPDPAKNFVGMSWLNPVITEILSDSKMTRHQTKFFDNAATPNLFVKVEGRMTDEGRTRLREDLERRHTGIENAYKTLVMDGGADLKVVGADFKQMDFVAALASNEARIAMAGGVPPIIIGLKAGLDAATYSNYGMAMRAFADHTIRPDWNSVVAALAQVVPAPAGSELWFDDSHVAALRQDATEEAAIRQTNANTLRTYIDAGFTPDSAIAAVSTGDVTALDHTGLFSVQLQPPGPEDTGVPVDTTGPPAPEGATP